MDRIFENQKIVWTIFLLCIFSVEVRSEEAAADLKVESAPAPVVDPNHTVVNGATTNQNGGANTAIPQLPEKNEAVEPFDTLNQRITQLQLMLCGDIDKTTYENGRTVVRSGNTSFTASDERVKIYDIDTTEYASALANAMPSRFKDEVFTGRRKTADVSLDILSNPSKASERDAFFSFLDNHLREEVTRKQKYYASNFPKPMNGSETMQSRISTAVENGMVKHFVTAESGFPGTIIENVILDSEQAPGFDLSVTYMPVKLETMDEASKKKGEKYFEMMIPAFTLVKRAAKDGELADAHMLCPKGAGTNLNFDKNGKHIPSPLFNAENLSKPATQKSLYQRYPQLVGISYNGITEEPIFIDEGKQMPKINFNPAVLAMNLDGTTQKDSLDKDDKEKKLAKELKEKLIKNDPNTVLAVDENGNAIPFTDEKDDDQYQEEALDKGPNYSPTSLSDYYKKVQEAQNQLKKLLKK